MTPKKTDIYLKTIDSRCLRIDNPGKQKTNKQTNKKQLGLILFSVYPTQEVDIVISNAISARTSVILFGDQSHYKGSVSFCKVKSLCRAKGSILNLKHINGAVNT